MSASLAAFLIRYRRAMNIFLVSEEVTSSPVEGLQVFTMHLCRYLDARHDLTVIHGNGEPEKQLESIKILPRKIPFSRKLAAFFGEASPDLVIYLPSSGLTAFGLLRSIVLQRLSGAPVMTLAMQDRKIGSLHGLISRAGFRGLVLSPSGALRESLERIGIRTGGIIPGIDERLFRPVSRERKSELRVKYGLPRENFIVLHVGHIKESRNIGIFLGYRDWGAGILALVKAGYVDPVWKERLSDAGVAVMDGYIEDVHELYQASDLYLFPVRSSKGALDFPLSVIEAAACGLPVVTTRFGALPRLMDESGCFRYFDDRSEIPGLIAEIRDNHAASGAGGEDFSWNAVLGKYLEPAIGEAVSSFKRKSR
jgi:glycosyltransferase involved in cell wall biosynthesis